MSNATPLSQDPKAVEAASRIILCKENTAEANAYYEASDMVRRAYFDYAKAVLEAAERARGEM